MNKKTKVIIAASSSTLIIILLSIMFEVRRSSILTPEIKSLTEKETSALEETLDGLYPERQKRLHRLPYKTGYSFEINSASAVVVDAATGNIIYEKNPDEVIPPASMTKLVEMAVVFEEIKNKNISMNDTVPLPPESWSKNLPYDASRMGLNEGDRVNLKTLLSGLAVASGNDASIAVANYVSGSMGNFVKRMNELIQSLNLKTTYFVESSGYSAENLTTPYEFTDFALWYIKSFPFSLKEFHSQKQLVYNGYTISNTNKLLDELEGCDGLKTGYIDESGYNLSLTAERNGQRFLAVIMRGPGHSTLEGNYYRSIDGKKLINYGFDNFETYTPEQDFIYTISNPCCREEAFNLIPAENLSFTVPKNTGKKMQYKIIKPDFVSEEVTAGQSLGKIIFYADGTALRTVDLVCDRTTTKKSGPSLLADKIVVWSLRRAR
ncbi:D-alanyl-D-alanine carboxypeptidase family protein [Treponema sp.]|uniref:D-alanyl-D-alanine carboxypeptidase family protein n=1 Tax=Treponema sp. TaxID=166 RepID=UPI00257A276F|nr:D-alanyl-D-alanine carboxypeptidase family protein [Treponema sp.]MBE6354371.1 D-alanyl-D-alanine carboxypeptidase [Treponema sp.]